MPAHVIWSLIRRRQEWFELGKRKGVKYSCSYYGISRKTYYKWWNRYQRSGFNPKSLQDRSRRPKMHPKTASKKVVERVIELRKQTGFGARRLVFYLKRDHGIKISVCGVHKILKRAGLIKIVVRKKKRYQSYAQYIRYPGHKIQMDVKYVPKRVGPLRRKEYQFSAIDLYTKLRFLRIYDEKSAYNAVDFTQRMLNFFPFPVKRIQTDHGIEFTYSFLDTPKLHPLTQLCRQKEIVHCLSPVATPRYNGQVERSHRTDMEEFYRRASFKDHQELSQKFFRYLRYYNESRPHMSLDMLTPLQKLKSFKNLNPNLNYRCYL
jgi:transposase InsO family protein